MRPHSIREEIVASSISLCDQRIGKIGRLKHPSGGDTCRNEWGNVKKALITGITGQDGSYLAKLLLDKGYEVHGAVRRSASSNRGRLIELGIVDAIHFHDFELLELTNIAQVIEAVKPDELYNLAAQSFVATSFRQPIYTSEADALGALRILEAIRHSGHPIRFYQASTSEMFGKVQEPTQTEKTPFYPRSPYGVSKLFAHWSTVNYREAYGLHGSSGILFNHESPLRGQEFVTRKITLTLAKIKHGRAESLELGNMNASRDWGFAGDFVEGMWRMLQQPKGDDYILATGAARSVRDFVRFAAEALEIPLEWEGNDLNEVARHAKSGKVIVKVNPEFFRPSEVDTLLGSAKKAREKLLWQPSTPFEKLVESMALADERRVRDNCLLF